MKVGTTLGKMSEGKFNYAIKKRGSWMIQSKLLFCRRMTEMMKMTKMTKMTEMRERVLFMCEVVLSDYG